MGSRADGAGVRLGALLLLLVLLAACGSGGGDATSQTGDGDTTTEPTGADGDAEADDDSAQSVEADDTTSDEGPFRIGVVVQTTGPAASTGNAQLNGARAGVAYLNDNGGILGREVELVIRDTAGDPAQAAAVTRQVIEGGVDALIAGALSGDYAAQLPIINDAEIFTISTASDDQYWEDVSINPWAFETYVTTATFPEVWLDYLTSNFDVQSIGILNSEDGFGLSIADLTQARAAELGLDVVAESFSVDATDVTAQLRALQGADVDALVLGSFSSSLVRSLQGLQAIGWDPPTVASNTLSEPATVDVVAQSGLSQAFGGPVPVAYLAVTTDDEPDSELTRDMLTAYGEILGSDDLEGFQINGGPWFDATIVIRAAFEAAGSADSAAARAVLEDGLEVETSQGTFVYSADSHVPQNLASLYGMFLGGSPCPQVCVAAPGVLDGN